LDMRVVDPSTGRIIYEQGEIDDTKWTPDSGGTWEAISDIQQDGSEGVVAKGSTTTKALIKSSFIGSDFILEGYGKQISDRVWGLGFRTSDAQNTYLLNIYEDLDLTDNLYLYKFSTSSGNSAIWNTALGPVDPNTWYKLSVKAYGDNFDVYVDDVLKTTSPAIDNSWPSGAVALYGESGTVAHFNDVRVRKYTTSEPSATVGDEQILKSLNLSVFLEGPYNGIDMNNDLNDFSSIPLSQPYNMTPWFYTGTENVATIPDSDIVDWVLIELRDAADAPSANEATTIHQQAVFLKNDGAIVGLDGSSLLFFNHSILQSLFVIVRHRNHLGIMSALPLTASPEHIHTYDFPDGDYTAYGSGQKNLGNDVYGMIGGDANTDGIVNNSDAIQAWMPQTGTAGYLSADINLNGQVNNPDKNDWWYNNINQASQIPD